MSKALDKLDATVKSEVQSGSAVKNMTRDQIVDEISAVVQNIRANLAFFQGLSPEQSEKLQNYFLDEKKFSGKKLSIDFLSDLSKHLIGKAKLTQEKQFGGAIVDALSSFGTIFQEIMENVNDLFGDKTFNLYNTKVSHVAVLGMVESARYTCQVAESFVDQFIADRAPNSFQKPAAYRSKFLKGAAEKTAEILNNVVNGRKSKSFAAAVKKYKASGNDVTVLGADGASSVQFSKLEGDIDELTIKSGSKGLKIFRILGNWWTDIQDTRARKQAALREQHLARVQFLQMELAGEDPNSERYQRLVKIIKNYEQMIDRLNQKLDKYYNED